MIGISQVTAYSILCALVPCLVYLFAARRGETFSHGVGAVVFVLCLWGVYDVAGAGTLADLLYRPDGDGSWMQGAVRLSPFQDADPASFGLGVALFVPLGVLLPLLWTGYRSLWRTVLFGAGLSLLVEVSQLLDVRTTSVTDLIANVLGMAAGYAAWRLVASLGGRRPAGRATGGVSEPVVYVALSFAGMFLLYYPLWFYEYVTPLLHG